MEYLLHQGASVHATDNLGHNALLLAIEFKSVVGFLYILNGITRQFEVIKLLVKTGAIICEPSSIVGIKLCQWVILVYLFNYSWNALWRAVANDDFDTITAWKLAGADLNVSDYGGKTALQLVSFMYESGKLYI